MVKFIVDSTFGLSKEYAKENDVKKVSLTVRIGEKEYPEGFNDEWDEFYSDYAQQKTAATTSQPAPRAFMDAIDEIYADNADADVIILTIGDRLSGTVGSANVAALQYPSKRVGVINTHCGAISAFLFLDEMVKAEKDGKNFDELMEFAEDLRERLSVTFIPASLTELARGGRVNKLISMIGTVLKIRPVFIYVHNELEVTAKCLGTKNAIASAVSGLPKKYDRLIACYIGDDKNVEMLKSKLCSELNLPDVEVYPVSPVLGAHIGVGTVGIAVLQSK